VSIRTTAALALIATSVVLPVAAQSARTRHASVAKVVAVRKSASHAGADTGTLVIAALGTAAVIGGAVAISSNSSPKSP
jgi:hypothetical protein